ncbi:MAG: hypothetical protein MJZ32_06130 [Bacteroidaceae bacterium]|nr:hypothetical protein [Bacteroidaceae bacterium]
MKIIKKIFSRTSEEVTPTERLLLQKVNSFDRIHPHIINALLISEVILFFSVIFMEA